MSDEGYVLVDSWVVRNAVNTFRQEYEKIKPKYTALVQEMKNNVVRKTLFLRKPVTEYDVVTNRNNWGYLKPWYYLEDKKRLTNEETHILQEYYYYRTHVKLDRLASVNFSKGVLLTSDQAVFVKKYGNGK